MKYEDFTNFAFWSFILVAIMLFYQSYINIVKKQYSRLSMDTIMLVVLRLAIGESEVKKAKRDYSKIQKIGFYALAGGILSIYYAFDWYIRYIH